MIEEKFGWQNRLLRHAARHVFVEMPKAVRGVYEFACKVLVRRYLFSSNCLLYLARTGVCLK